MSERRAIKCVAVGDGAVGKTSLLISYSTGQFPSDYVPTVFESYAVDVDIGGRTWTLGLFDTAGQEGFDHVRTLSYHKTDVFLVCFSLVNDASYHNVRELWVRDIRRNSPRCPIVLVGTQLDLRSASDRPVVTHEMGRRLGCRIKAAKYENVNTVFQEVILAATQHNRSKLNSACDLL
uniref:Ras homolog family member H n=1 Tax=Macrostomum lignano TaxID=282301 RepID=A0A1I8J661_9PLAT